MCVCVCVCVCVCFRLRIIIVAVVKNKILIVNLPLVYIGHLSVILLCLMAVSQIISRLHNSKTFSGEKSSYWFIVATSKSKQCTFNKSREIVVCTVTNINTLDWCILILFYGLFLRNVGHVFQNIKIVFSKVFGQNATATFVCVQDGTDAVWDVEGCKLHRTLWQRLAFYMEILNLFTPVYICDDSFIICSCCFKIGW